MGALIAILDRNSKNATETAIMMLKILTPKNTEYFGIASPQTTSIGKTIGKLKTGNMNSPTIIGHAFTEILKEDKPQPILLENAAALVFEGRIYSDKTRTCFQKSKANREAIAEILIKNVRGDFAFAITESEKIIAGRDAISAKPLYYGENKDLAALASERKALWKIGVNKAESFPPGHLAIVDRNGFKFKSVKTLVPSQPKTPTMQAAAKKLQKLLQCSTQERVSGLKEVAVAFSGGLDSGLIAFLAKDSTQTIHLIHVSLEDQLETEHAKQVAEELKLPIHTYLYKQQQIEQILPEVLWLIEEPDPVKTSIGIPLYWATERAAELKLKVMLAGQGADEYFGGYQRYVDDYLQRGPEKTKKAILDDIFRMHETNLERDSKIANYHGIELRLPFATYQIAEYASQLPLQLKLEPSKTTLRKLVLRKIAENLGLPKSITEKPKKAIQYTTGVSKALQKLAKKQELPVDQYLQKTFQKIYNKRMYND